MIYISGPISGTKDYKTRFAAAERYIKRTTKKTPVNPERVNRELPEGTKYEEYMIMSLTMLSFCDSIYMMYGWWDSAGARMEKALAVSKGIHIFYEKWPRRTWRNWWKLRKAEKRRKKAREDVMKICTNGKRLVEIVAKEAVEEGHTEEEVLRSIYAAAQRGADFSWCADMVQIEHQILEVEKQRAIRTFKAALDRVKEIHGSMTLGEEGMRSENRKKEAETNGTGN